MLLGRVSPAHFREAVPELRAFEEDQRKVEPGGMRRGRVEDRAGALKSEKAVLSSHMGHRFHL